MKSQMKKKLLQFTLIALLNAPALVFCQNAAPTTRVSLYYVLNSWKTDYPSQNGSPASEDKLREGVFGLNVTLAPSDRFRFDLNGASTSSKYTNGDDDAKEFKLSSINDTKLRGTYFVSSGKASASVYANLPTGKKELDDEQYLVSRAVSDNFRKFVTRRFGQGLDLGAEFFVLPQTGFISFQIGGGFLYKGKYFVQKDDSLEYKYGDEVSGKFAVTYDKAPVGVTAGVTLRYYLKDKFGDDEVFQAGVSSSIGASVFYNESLSLNAGFNILNRGKAKIKSLGEEKLSDESLKSGRNEFLFYAGGSYPATPELRLLARLEYQGLSANEYDEDGLLFRPKSNYVGISGGAAYALTETITASGMISFYSGSINNDDDLSGTGLALVLTYRAR